MVYIAGGSFDMGSNIKDLDSRWPIHKVTLSSFYMGKYEITQSQWLSVMGKNPSENKKCPSCPVEYVDWYDIQDYLKKINSKTGKNYRLPTEAEWEYAAKGGQNYKYAGSNNADDVSFPIGIGVTTINGGKQTYPVGKKMANGYGLYDMTGNVYEWCSDWYGEDYYSKSPELNPQGPSSGTAKVCRSGGGGDVIEITGRYRWASPEGGGNSIGFRVVISE